MNILYNIILCYAFFINALAMIVFGIDKRRAKRHKWRIPEKTLLLLACVGGSAGALCGMYMFRHKTLRKKFFIGLPMILVAQVLLIFYLYLH